jgi:dihydrodipicolinate synthase/N-acetylneuraminate lyase
LIPGIYVPTLCFFHSDSEDVDLETVSNHAVRLAQAGVAGITVHGSNGEAVHLSHEERNAVTSATRKSLDRAGYSNMPLMVGCSAQSTRETIRLCQQAQVAGGDYALVLTAAYYQTLFTPDTITQFYRDVADASPIPIVIYNYPGAVSGLDLSSDILISLSTHPNIVGCKFTCGNTGKLNRVAAAAAANARKSSSSSPFLCFGGSGDFTLQTLIGGGSGIIGGIANIAPKTCVRVYDLYRAGELQEAQRVQAVLARGDWAAIKSGVVGLKSAMQSHCGYGGYGRRPLPRPMGAKSKAYAEEFRELVEFERRL